MIPRGAEAQFDGAAVETLVETLGIQIAGAFIEQIGDQIADAGLVGGILGSAAAESVFHRDQRHGSVLHEPGLDASRRNQMLNFCRSLRWRRSQQDHSKTGRKNEGDAPRANLRMGHERFPSRLAAVPSIRYPSTQPFFPTPS